MHKADLILQGTIVPCTTPEVVKDGAIAIKDGIIVALDHKSVMAKQYHADLVIDASHGVIMPGLINGHTHVGMTMMRGVGDDAKNLHDWLTNYIFPWKKNYLAKSLSTGQPCSPVTK